MGYFPSNRVRSRCHQRLISIQIVGPLESSFGNYSALGRYAADSDMDDTIPDSISRIYQSRDHRACDLRISHAMPYRLPSGSLQDHDGVLVRTSGGSTLLPEST